MTDHFTPADEDLELDLTPEEPGPSPADEVVAMSTAEAIEYDELEQALRYLHAARAMHTPEERPLANGRVQVCCSSCGIGWTIWPCAHAVALGIAPDDRAPSRLQMRWAGGERA